MAAQACTGWKSMQHHSGPALPAGNAGEVELCPSLHGFNCLPLRDLITLLPFALSLPHPPAVRNGHIKRITDSDISSSVLEIAGTNVSTTYITCPADPKKTLGIKLPFLVMIIKNLKKYFTFEVTVLDDKNVHRRFRASNYQVSNVRDLT